MVPPAFAANGGLGVRCNGRSRPSYNTPRSKRDLLLRGQPPFDCRNERGAQGKGEVDFAAYPAISH